MSQAEIDAIVAGIAHAVRNPLFSISANLEALPAGVLRDERAAPFLATIRSELARIGRLIDQLAEFGGIAEPQVVSGDLAQVLGRALSEAAPAARSRSIELRLAAPPALPPLPMDAGQIALALGKIMENAVQNATALVEVEIRFDPAQGASTVEVEVRDDGPGFHPMALERGLEPFFKTASTGSGLGLAIAREILDRHGATVALSNRHPQGACVRISLRTTAPEAA